MMHSKIPDRRFIGRRVALFGLFLVSATGACARADTLALDRKGSSLTFVGESLLHNFHGEATVFTGEAELARDAVPPIQKATLHFSTASLTTSLDARDEKMRAWLNIKVHPDASFQLESVRLVSGDYKTATSADPASFAVSGTFLFNGVKQPLAGTAKGWRAKDRVIVSGETIVDTLKHGLPQIREAAVLTVGTSVKVAFRFSFILPPDYAAN